MTKREASDLKLEDDRLRRLYAYWLGRRGEREFPSKAEIDPVEFPYVLGYVTLVDVEESPRRYYFRLDGSILVELSGQNYTGRYLDELSEELGEKYVAFIKETYDRVVDGGQPYRYHKNDLFDEQYFSEETLILPLGDHPPGVERLIVAVIPRDLPHRDDQKVVI